MQSSTYQYLHPSHPSAYPSISPIASLQGEPFLAEALLRVALETDRSCPFARTQLVFWELRFGSCVEALKHLRILVKALPHADVSTSPTLCWVKYAAGGVVQRWRDGVGGGLAMADGKDKHGENVIRHFFFSFHHSHNKTTYRVENQ